MKSTGPFRIRKIEVRDHGCRYATFLVEGYLGGRRVRRKFQRYEENRQEGDDERACPSFTGAAN